MSKEPIILFRKVLSCPYCLCPYEPKEKYTDNDYYTCLWCGGKVTKLSDELMMKLFELEVDDERLKDWLQEMTA